MGDKCNSIKELIRSYSDNCSAAEDAALKFLGTDIGLDHMPVLNVPTLRDLVKGDFWKLLRRGKDTFCNPVENALFLVVLTDYVTCAVRNVQLFDIFKNKKDLTHGVPSLLTYIDSYWNRMFCLLSTPDDMSVEQLRSLVSLFKKAINRLPTKIQRDCFSQALNAGEQQLYYADMMHTARKRQELDTVHSTLNQAQEQSEDEQLSYTSIKNCETPKYELDFSLKERYLTLNEERFESKQKSVKMKKCSDVVTDIPESISLALPQKDVHKKKKPRFSSDITKYMCSVAKKDPVNTNSSPIALEKNVLEVTSKENVPVPSVDKRAITPPFSTVPDEPAKGSLDTPPDQPTVINLCSPTKKMPVPDAAQLTVAANGKKNAFAIMMQRSKENSKRKALFPLGHGGKV